MGVKLRIARRQTANQAPRIGLVHPRILEQTKYPFRMAEPTSVQHGAGARCQRMKNERMEQAVRQAARCQPKIEPQRVKGEADPSNPQDLGIFHQNIKDRRMQMQMQMAINVVQCESCSTELFKLGVYFRAQLFQIG